MSSDNTAAGPAADPTQPSYYADRAPASEHQLRADFARSYRQQMAYLVNPSQENLPAYQEALDTDRRWRWGDDPVMAEKWGYLSDAVDSWDSIPDLMARALTIVEARRAHGDTEDITDEGWRSQQQARELTGHGVWNPGTESGRTTTRSANAFGPVQANAFGPTSNRTEQGMSR